MRLPRAQTLEALARQQPSSIPPETLAILNQVQPSSTLASGTLVK